MVFNLQSITWGAIKQIIYLNEFLVNSCLFDNDFRRSIYILCRNRLNLSKHLLAHNITRSPLTGSQYHPPPPLPSSLSPPPPLHLSVFFLLFFNLPSETWPLIFNCIGLILLTRGGTEHLFIFYFICLAPSSSNFYCFYFYYLASRCART